MKSQRVSDNRRKNTSAAKGRGVVRLFVFIVAVIVLVVSLYKLAGIWMQRRRTEEYNQKIADAVLTVPESSAPADGSLPFSFNAEAAAALSPDFKGYLYIPSVDIRQPVAQGKDDDEYLHKELDGTPSDSGTPFIESVVTEGLRGSHVMIFGHNCYGVFDNLIRYYESESFATDPDNAVFYLYHGDRVSKYRIFSLLTTEPVSDCFTFNFSSVESLRSFAQEMKSRSMYSFDTDISDLTQVMSITCCQYDDISRRMILFASYVGDVGNETVSGSVFTPGGTAD